MKTLALPLTLMLLSASSWGAPASVPLDAASSLSPSISREASRTPSKGPEERFTGNVRVAYLFPANAPAKATG